MKLSNQFLFIWQNYSTLQSRLLLCIEQKTGDVSGEKFRRVAPEFPVPQALSFPIRFAAAFFRKRIKGTCNGFIHFMKVKIKSCGLNKCVCQQFFDLTNVYSGFQEMCGKAMP